MPMSLLPDPTVFQQRLAALPLAAYQAGETVLAAGSTTGRLLILREGRSKSSRKASRSPR